MTDTQATPTSTIVVFRRAMAAEWTRLWSVRSTYWALFAGTAIMLLMGATFGQDTAGDPPLPLWLAAEFAIIPGQFAFLLIPMLAVTAEYGNGAIRSSLQWVPRRGLLFTARTVVSLAVTVVAAVLLAVATDLVAWAWMGDSALVDAGDIGRSLASIALYITMSALLTIGLSWATRNSAATLTTVFLLQLVLPMIMPVFGVPALTTVAEHLPGFAGVSLLDAIGVSLATGTVVTVFLAWIGGAMGAGVWSLTRRDSA